MEKHDSKTMNDTSTKNEASDATTSQAPTSNPEKKESVFQELVRFVLITLIIVVPIRIFIAQPFIVSGSSMVDTFHSGEYLIVDQLTYRFKEPARGDVIVFRYPNDPSKHFIKRIIGIPGDIITIQNNSITLSNESLDEDIILEEPYVAKDVVYSPMTAILKEDEYFVLGDNRAASSDSRIWGILPKENIAGRAFIRLFPLNLIDVFPGKHQLLLTDASSLPDQ